MKDISISWSGGKDSAMALYKIMQSNEYDIIGLHTVFDNETKRVGIHNIHEQLIEAQAIAMDIPLTKLYLSKRAMAYQKLLTDYYKRLKSSGVEYVMFGDIFLEDLKDFREMMLNTADIGGVYPLWHKNTNDLIIEFLESDFQSVLCAVDAKFIDSKDCGKLISSSFIENYPAINPCGEKGEYHSFVVEGLLFNSKIGLNVNNIYSQEHIFKMKDEEGSEIELKELFYYADLELLSKS